MHAKVWKLAVGRINLYLLDTDIPENNTEDRAITAQLYGGDLEMRIRQEIVLGMGGPRALAALGLKPSVYHMNEGHAAFLGLERIRHFVRAHQLDFRSALQIVAGQRHLHDAHAGAGGQRRVFARTDRGITSAIIPRRSASISSILQPRARRRSTRPTTSP